MKLKINENELIKLKNEKSELDKKLKSSQKSNEELKKINIGLNQNIKYKDDEIKKLNNSKKDKDNVIKEKNIIINDLSKEVNDLKEQLKSYPLKLSKGEKLISIIFTSLDESIHYSIISKNTEIFHELEKKLYNHYPKYSDSNNYCMKNGNRINKSKSLDENEIKNGDIIILSQNYI